MELPIDEKDLDTIINALSLGGDTRLYFLLKNFKEDRIISMKQETSIADSNVLLAIKNTNPVIISQLYSPKKLSIIFVSI